MANIFQAAANIKKYGLKNALRGALQTPGGYLDQTQYNPNNAFAIQNGVAPGSYATGQQYYDTNSQSYNHFPTMVGAATYDTSAGMPGMSPDTYGGLPGMEPSTTTSTQPVSSDSTSGGTTQTYTPNLVEYPPGSGYYYDLNDVTQKQAFYDRRLVDLQQSRDQQIAAIDQNIADLTGSSKDYVTNYFKQLENFGAVKGAGDINRIDTYTQASPNAFQSSEANSYDLANQNYLTGVGDAAQQANTDVGAAYLANPNDPSLLGADTTYGRQQQNYFGGRNDVLSQYNDYLAGIQQQNDPSTNPFGYAYHAAGLNAPAAVNLSGAAPSVNFTQTAPNATPGPNFRPVGRSGISDQTPLQNFLGQTQLNPQDTDFLRKYLIGRPA
jgi:hypothetical protein